MAELAEETELEDVPEEGSDPSQTSSEGTALLKERYLIDGGQPLAFMHSPNALAYVVTDSKNPETSLCAYVCDPNLPVRIDTMSKLKTASSIGLKPLIDWGLAFNRS